MKFSSKISQELLDLAVKNWYNIRYDKLYGVFKNQSYMGLISLFICPFFFLSNNCSIISAQHLYVLESSNFVYTMRTTKCITVNKEMLKFIFAFFFYFCLFLSLTPM